MRRKYMEVCMRGKEEKGAVSSWIFVESTLYKAVLVGCGKPKQQYSQSRK